MTQEALTSNFGAMWRITKRIGLVLFGIWAGLRFLLDYWGYMQAIREALENRGPIVAAVGPVLSSQWLPLGLFLGGVLISCYVELCHAWVVRNWLHKEEAPVVSDDVRIWEGIKSAWEEAVSLRHEWHQNDSNPPLQKTEGFINRTLAFAKDNLSYAAVQKLDNPLGATRHTFDPMRSPLDMVNYWWGRLNDYERHLQDIMQTYSPSPETSVPFSPAPTQAAHQPIVNDAGPRVVPPKPPEIPTIRTACRNDLLGCSPTNAWRSGVVRFFRMAVDSQWQNAPLPKCQARLISIKRGEERLWGGDTAILTFAPGEDEDATSKTLYYGQTEYVDVVAIASNGELFPGTKDRLWRFMPRLTDIFSKHGEFVLTVVIVGDMIQTHTTTLKFTWTGSHETSALEAITLPS